MLCTRRLPFHLTLLPVTLMQDGGRFNISDKQRLVIHNVTQNDTGFYTCIAYNSLAQTHARAYLSVVEGKKRLMRQVKTENTIRCWPLSRG